MDETHSDTEDSASVVITVGGDRELTEVAKDLSTAGLLITATLQEINVVIGRAPLGAIGRFRSIDGVVDATLDEAVDIGPPDAPIT
jgi:hypothetical protein